jgi:hypothetical protein
LDSTNDSTSAPRKTIIGWVCDSPAGVHGNTYWAY